MARDEYVSKHTGAELDAAIEAILKVNDMIPVINDLVNRVGNLEQMLQVQIPEIRAIAEEAKNRASQALNLAENNRVEIKGVEEELNRHKIEFFKLKDKVYRYHPY